ncbi:hypothetical protein HHI36_021530, partial [Cryptolaemus montrouzieri]
FKLSSRDTTSFDFKEKSSRVNFTNSYSNQGTWINLKCRKVFIMLKSVEIEPLTLHSTNQTEACRFYCNNRQGDERYKLQTQIELAEYNIFLLNKLILSPKVITTIMGEECSSAEYYKCDLLLICAISFLLPKSSTSMYKL